MLQLKNDTPFAANIMLLPDAEGIDTLFAVVKGTFTIGQTFGLADVQVPVVLADEHHGDPASSSIRAPSDVCLGKRGTDVLLIGSAWAPAGRPTWQMDVSVAVGPLTRSMRIFGDRVWQESAGVASVAWVAPFERMPLVWERAYGGMDVTPKGPIANARNPVGAGFRVSNGEKPLTGLPLPNIEMADRLISSWSDSPPPVCCAPVAPHWEPRRSYAGTYDDNWQTQRAPYLPSDFDLRFFQLAPPEQITPSFLQGGELVELNGVTPTGNLRFLLPALQLSATFRFDRGEERRPVVLDTVLLEPDASRLMLVWRAALNCDKRALKVKEVHTTIVQ